MSMARGCAQPALQQAEPDGCRDDPNGEETAVSLLAHSSSESLNQDVEADLAQGDGPFPPSPSSPAHPPGAL